MSVTSGTDGAATGHNRNRGVCGAGVALLAIALAAGCAFNGGKPSPRQTPAGPKVMKQTPAPRERALFDGKSLAGWKVTDFAGGGEVGVKDGRIVLGMGFMTGITWTNPVPRMSYEISLEAMRVEGSDFFCGLTFPVGPDQCSFIVGGWGGGVVGLSSLDSEDAAHNDTTQYMNFETGRWYAIRVRVLPGRIEAWIDGDRVVNADLTGRTVSIRPEVEPSVPLGIATWSTTGALRNLRLREF